MNRIIFITILIVSLILSPLASAARRDFIRGGRGTEKTDVGGGETAGVETISQQEYDQKVRSAKGLRMVGYVLSGAGSAALLAGFVVMLSVSPSTSSLNTVTSRLAASLFTMMGGAAVGLPGAVICVIGKSRLKKLQKMQITALPQLVPEREAYGLTLSARF